MSDPGDLWGEQLRLRPRQVLFDVLTASVFVLLAVLTVQNLPWPVVAGTVAMGLALAVRRLSWPLMVALGVLAGLGQLTAGEIALLTDLGYLPIFFVLGAYSDARVRRFGLAAVPATAAVLATAVGTDTVEMGAGGSDTFYVVASAALATTVAGGGWALGFARWQSRARIRAQVQAGLEQERTRIAADMHDLVAHTWAVVAAQADGARYALQGPHGDRKAAEALDVIADTARGSIADLRDLLAELRYREPARPPGQSARDALLTRMRASGMELRLTEHGEPSGSGSLAVAARRLLSEALTNALKHGDLAHPVDVEEDWRDGYRLTVRNHVKPGRDAPGTGHGLEGMRERVTLAGGTFSAGLSGDCWTVRAELPESA